MTNKRLVLTSIPVLLLIVVSLAIFVVIGANMLPYQDAPPDLAKQYTQYVATVTPIWYGSLITLMCSSCSLFLIMVVLVYRLIAKKSND